MAGKEESEQKTLPASQKKLREARRKGQVSNSRDLVSGFSLLAVVLYMVFTWTYTRDHVLQVVDLIANSYGQPFDERWQAAVTAASAALMYTILPAVGILVITSIVVGMAGTFGPVFSFESVKLNFDHINPVSGLKRIFAMRNLVEFAKGLVKIALVGGALWFVLKGWLEPFLKTPGCGEACVLPVLLEALKPIIIIGLLAFILIGLLDIMVQRWLFLQDMRMTKTEMKRERKDMEGDPHIRAERSRQRRMAAMQSVRLGIKEAVVVIAHGDRLGAVRYHRKHSPVPMIVARAKGEKAYAMRSEALRLGIPVVDDATLAGQIAAKHKPGDILNRDLFAPVAGILVRHGLV